MRRNAYENRALTLTLAQRRLGLYASENKKRMPLKTFFVVVSQAKQGGLFRVSHGHRPTATGPLDPFFIVSFPADNSGDVLITASKNFFKGYGKSFFVIL